jgi:hypothetical protein
VVAERDHREREERGDHRHHRREREGPSIGGRGTEVLLEEELDAVGQGLEEAEWAPPIRPDTRLHVGDNPALEPDHQQRRHEQDREDDHDLDRGDDDLGADEVDDVAGEALDPVDHGLATSTRESTPDIRVLALTSRWS